METATQQSNTSALQEVVALSKRDPISSEMLHLIHIVMTGVWYTICFTGMVTNIINIRTFWKIGLEDSVTVSLFSLAMSDFSLCSVAVLELTTFFADVLGREYHLFFYVPPLIITLYCMCIRRIFTTTTVIITTFLAVQRCLCVALPFHVKSLFTRLRTIVFFVVVLSFDAIVHLLFLSQHPTYVMLDIVTNTTQIALTVPDSSKPVPIIIEVIIGIGLNISCQVIVVICLIVLGINLSKSIQFKKTVATAGFSTNEKLQNSSDATKASDVTKTSLKEHQAMIQVSLVSIIFVACNLPLLTFGIANIIVPEIDMYGEFHNLYHFIQNIMYTAELLNSSVNLIVYYNYNTKFRNCFRKKKI